MPKTVSVEVDDVLYNTFLEFAGDDLPTLKAEAARYLGNMMKSRCEGHIEREIETLLEEPVPNEAAIGALQVKIKTIKDASVTITGVS